MKFDKETLIAIAVCCVVLFGWEPFSRYMGWSAAPVPPAAAAPAAAPQPNTEVPVPAVPAAEPAVPEKKTQEALVQVSPLPPVELKNKDMVLSFDPVRGSIRSITLEHYQNAARDARIVLDQSFLSQGALSLYQAGVPWVVTQVVKNRVEPGSDGQSRYLLDRRIQTIGGDDFLLSQVWEIGATGYETDCSFQITNLARRPLVLNQLIMNGGDLAAWAMISGDKMRTPSHRMDFETADGSFYDIKADKKDDADYFQNPAPMVDWAGISNKYFGVILTAKEPFQLFQGRTMQMRGKDKVYIPTVGARLPAMMLNAGESKSVAFRYYSGPKMTQLLEAFEPSTNRMMHLAWGPLDYLARLLLWVLVQLHGFCGSYGVSIIILTLMVRLLFYPVTAKANASMRKMQAVQPKIAALREKYKDNPQLLNSKMMELYREEKVNPFGGCLPILLQIPVFFALYATLDGAVQLRQVSFLWAKDLAAADTVAKIPLYFYDLPINPLVLMMTALMMIQQRMTPMAMDPMQKKMMLMMPVVMLIFLYDLPSGLTLYWTVSNFFSIIQLKLQQKAHPVAAVPVKNAN